jgi:hypothetical protein
MHNNTISILHYVSIFADLDARRVIFGTEGRSAETVARFAADLVEHGGDPAKITDTSSDMRQTPAPT